MSRLLEINRRFYQESGADFARTRGHVQPGVERALASIDVDAAILDLGCGNGTFATQLSDSGHRGPYTGLDFSLPMLKQARQRRYAFRANFLYFDLAGKAAHKEGLNDSSEDLNDLIPAGTRNARVVTAFAFFHHIPGRALRLELLQRIRSSMQQEGRLILSNWQFTSNPRMMSRLMPWSTAGLREDEVDSGDYLVAWRGGAAGVRYVHEFTEGELLDLAGSAGFLITGTFLADGVDHRSGLYMTWRPT